MRRICASLSFALARDSCTATTSYTADEVGVNGDDHLRCCHEGLRPCFAHPTAPSLTSRAPESHRFAHEDNPERAVHRAHKRGQGALVWYAAKS